MPPGVKRPFKKGGARLAVHTGRPAVPVAHNAGDCWPKKQLLQVPRHHTRGRRHTDRARRAERGGDQPDRRAVDRRHPPPHPRRRLTELPPSRRLARRWRKGRQSPPTPWTPVVSSGIQDLLCRPTSGRDDSMDVSGPGGNCCAKAGNFRQRSELDCMTGISQPSRPLGHSIVVVHGTFSGLAGIAAQKPR